MSPTIAHRNPGNPDDFGRREEVKREARMGSMKFRSEGRGLVRERRVARMRRNGERRQARELKRSQTATTPAAISATRRLAEEQVQATLERIVTDALDRHDQRPASAVSISRPVPSAAVVEQPVAALSARSVEGRTPARPVERTRVSRRDRDIAACRERRRTVASEARREARVRIARQGEPGAVADALGAIRDPTGDPWQRERELLEQALASGRVAEIGATARRALWAVSRDAARTSRRASGDRDLAAAVCVCCAIVARLPRTALRSQQRTAPRPRVRASSGRAFWR
jgi:hypothetical protein